MHIRFGIADSIDKFVDTAGRLLDDIVSQLACRLDANAGKAAELFRQLI